MSGTLPESLTTRLLATATPEVVEALVSAADIDTAARAAVIGRADLPPELGKAAARRWGLDWQIHWAVTRATGPADVAGYFDGAAEAELLIVSELMKLDESGATWPAFVWEELATIANERAFSELIRRAPDECLAHLVPRLEAFGLGSAHVVRVLYTPRVLAAARSHASAEFRAELLGRVVSGSFGEPGTDVPVSDDDLDIWFGEHVPAEITAGHMRLRHAGVDMLVNCLGWRCIPHVERHADHIIEALRSTGVTGAVTRATVPESLRPLWPVQAVFSANAGGTWAAGRPWAELVDAAASSESAVHTELVEGIVALGDHGLSAPEHIGWIVHLVAANPAVDDGVLIELGRYVASHYLRHAFCAGLVTRRTVAPAVVASTFGTWHGAERALGFIRAADDRPAMVRACIQAPGHPDAVAIVEGLCRNSWWLDEYAELLDGAAALGVLELADGKGPARPDRPSVSEPAAAIAQLVAAMADTPARLRLLLELLPTHPGNLADLAAVLSAT